MVQVLWMFVSVCVISNPPKMTFNFTWNATCLHIWPCLLRLLKTHCRQQGNLLLVLFKKRIDLQQHCLQRIPKQCPLCKDNPGSINIMFFWVYRSLDWFGVGSIFDSNNPPTLFVWAYLEIPRLASPQACKVCLGSLGTSKVWMKPYLLFGGGCFRLLRTKKPSTINHQKPNESLKTRIFTRKNKGEHGTGPSRTLDLLWDLPQVSMSFPRELFFFVEGEWCHDLKKA